MRSTQALLFSLGVAITGSVAMAQSLQYPFAQTKAANQARMRAERLNGGLSRYRADRCMYVLRGEGCLVSNTESGFVFRFQGGAPGWQQQTPPQPTVLTEIRVSADGDRILDVPYNGPLLTDTQDNIPSTSQDP
ncbi:hypothetical protein KR100_04145 [Synechococcus sp. KORDI-100]|uniref:hypothetical protein n=1 Tax=Synechococcus sp. KORDI-100 TaxID=1280380 RepID=UPI0004E041AE|nr:hypothetical protein [Synechococcus sp. KORDI-100]AII42557.1 hypothetical protein KR100_04145 [Synechococcus sp. KORDI-100]